MKALTGSVTRLVGRAFLGLLSLRWLLPFRRDLRSRLELANLPQSDVNWVLGRICSPSQWTPAWEQLGRRYENDGETLQGVAKGKAFKRAASAYYFAQRALLAANPERTRLYTKAVKFYTQSTRLLGCKFEAVRIPTDAGDLAAYLEICDQEGHRPALIILPGVGAAKEEMEPFSSGFLEAGFHVLRVDPPGHGETRFPLTLDAEKHLVCAVDWLAKREDVDNSRIGLLGVSLGGYWAIRLAVADDRIAFCETISAPFTPRPYMDDLSKHIWSAFQASFAQPDYRSTRRLLGQMTLEGIADNLSRPLLILHGDRDETIPPSEADLIARGVGTQAQIHRHPKGDHACVSVLREWAIPMLVAWPRC